MVEKGWPPSIGKGKPHNNFGILNSHFSREVTIRMAAETMEITETEETKETTKTLEKMKMIKS